MNKLICFGIAATFIFTASLAQAKAPQDQIDRLRDGRKLRLKR